jgi:hypothetical protein
MIRGRRLIVVVAMIAVGVLAVAVLAVVVVMGVVVIDVTGVVVVIVCVRRPTRCRRIGRRAGRGRGRGHGPRGRTPGARREHESYCVSREHRRVLARRAAGA